MSDVYDSLPFDNPDGGPWKQGWVVTYDRSKITDKKKKLKVILMPHTHCDPGRIKFNQFTGWTCKNCSKMQSSLL